MPLKCTCPRCGKLHRNIDKQLLGKKFQCDCGKVMKLGEPPEKKSEEPAAAKIPKRVPPMVAPTRIDEAAISAQEQDIPRPPDKVSIEGISPPSPTASPANDVGKPAEKIVQEADSPVAAATPEKPAPSAPLGSEFADVDEVIGVHDMGAPAPTAPEVVDELPIAEPVDSASAEINNDLLQPSVSAELDEQSFEVLDDSEEDVIDLSDADVVAGPTPVTATAAPSGGARFQNMPERPPEPVVAERVYTPEPVTASPAATQPTLTSQNPAYKAFGPPPAAHYPSEPAVPDGASAEAAVGTTVMRPGPGGYAGGQSGMAVEAIFALIVSFLAVVFGLWVSFQSYQVVNYFLPGTAYPSGNLSGQAGVLAFLFGFRLLAGLGLLVGGSLFFVNEIMRMNSTDPMPYSCIIALFAGCCFLLVQFGVACYGLFNSSAMAAYGINLGGTVFLILLATFLNSLIPIALVVFAALRQR